MSIKFVDAEGNLLLNEIKLPATETKSKDGEEARLVIAGNIQAVNLPSYGDYYVELNVNGNLSRLPFKVIR